MRKQQAKQRAAISTVLALAVVSAFTLSSFAAGTDNKSPGRTAFSSMARLRLETSAGKLFGTGAITIDGEQASEGVTILSGSRVATGEDGAAVVDLGPLGRIELRPNTTITLSFSDTVVNVIVERAGAITQRLAMGITGHIKFLSGSVRIAVSKGRLEVNSRAGSQMLNEGEQATLDKSAEAVATGEAVFVAGDGSAVGGSPSVVAASDSSTPGLVGVIAFAGVVAGVTVGVVAGRNDNKQPLPKPSEVVP
ncbi:MAG TPA: hypothetical protein VNN73_01505 [Blastocatellia bacterium]|nr:hypothetical protein [Blastocatellia bacterium]